MPAIATRSSVAALVLSLVLAPLSAQGAPSRSDVTEIQVPGKRARARVWSETGADGRAVPYYSLSLDGERFAEPRATSYELQLRYARFDPRVADAGPPPQLAARPGSRVHIVQFWTQGIEGYRSSLRDLGVELHRFLANHACVVEADEAALAAVRELPFVRAVVPFHPAYKLEEELLQGLEEGRTGPVTVDLLTLRRAGHAPVIRWVEEHGGTVEHVSEPTYLMTVTLDFALLAELAALDAVQWIDRWGPPEPDMNKARQLHGTDYVETVHGLSGAGVRVEVMDAGCDTTHPDLQAYLVHNGNTADAHGTCTSGIVLGDGAGRVGSRGVAPDAFLVVADYGFNYAGGNRYNHTGQLVNPALSYQCVVQSNSWGGSLTTQYNSTSQNMDLILFDHERISICQSQSNTGSTSSRPEAWAKNVISVGGIIHGDTTSTSDDTWGGGASIGPAADGRIKPDVASFYDWILCADMVGPDGYSNSNYYNNFGGTSGATPIVAGHVALVCQLWHLGLFGNPTPGATVFENAPNNTTIKALLVNSATQWTFSGTGHDLTRVHQGWGHPDLQKLSTGLVHMLVVDESDVLTELQSQSYPVVALPGEPELRVTLVYRDPPGTTSSTVHRINDLDLTVTSPSGTLYRGNVGLNANMWSTPGGSANTKDTVENVFVQAPEAGTWTVTVTASDVNEDSHVETGAVDVDYALVVSGAETNPTAPAAPAGLEGRAASHQVHLSFRDESDDEDGFELERSTDGVTFLPLATLAANDTDHVDPGLTPGTTYHYRVRAFNAVGPSAWSNVVGLTTNKASK